MSGFAGIFFFLVRCSVSYTAPHVSNLTKKIGARFCTPSSLACLSRQALSSQAPPFLAFKHIWSRHSINQRCPFPRLRFLVVDRWQVREKRGTWRLPSDVTTVERRRVERENRSRNSDRRGPGATALSPHGGSAVDVGDRRSAAAGASFASSSSSRLAGKLGVRPPPPIDIPPSPRITSVRSAAQDRGTSDLDRNDSANASGRSTQSAPLLRDVSAQVLHAGKDEDGEEKQRAAAHEVERQDQAELSSDNAMPPTAARRGSVASTRQSYLSTMSAHSYRSMEESGGGLGSPTGSASSERGRGSDSNSDSDEFFDAVALDTDTDGGKMHCSFDSEFLQLVNIYIYFIYTSYIYPRANFI